MSNGRLTSSDNDGIGIAKFIQGNNFFITGATGFLGKVLVEKILRSTPNVGKIFLLVRGKDKEEAMARVKNEIVDVALFKSLKETHGNLFEEFITSKLIPVVGNVGEPNLGLDTLTTRGITEIYISRYDVLLNTNAKGPAIVLEFAKKCKKLKLLLHVSTVYVNGERPGVILEKPLCWEERTPGKASLLDVDSEMKLALDIVEAYDGRERIQKLKELGRRRMRGNIPVVIVRPPNIGSTYEQPFPGWIEGLRVVDPILCSYGQGQLPGFAADPNTVLDIVPGDMVVNAIIAIMAKHGTTTTTQLYLPYTFIKARFDMENIKNLMREMSVVEMNDFGFDVESIDWENYFKRIHLPGLRRHALKEPPARARL
ncbi:hypothetical protein Tsubulata_011567 [Turnera subulata]|uniref:Fatty acyl-CoA reductase n=1 Tax=Turnera subulata TaxID=218843 RepID=A0A9Q0JP68_9ROSI|nr:hypothetical protein Tsubulata_011567 [Turnera subulata]